MDILKKFSDKIGLEVVERWDTKFWFSILNVFIILFLIYFLLFVFDKEKLFIRNTDIIIGHNSSSQYTFNLTENSASKSTKLPSGLVYNKQSKHSSAKYSISHFPVTKKCRKLLR